MWMVPRLRVHAKLNLVSFGACADCLPYVTHALFSGFERFGRKLISFIGLAGLHINRPLVWRKITKRTTSYWSQHDVTMWSQHSTCGRFYRFLELFNVICSLALIKMLIKSKKTKISLTKLVFKDLFYMGFTLWRHQVASEPALKW